MRTNGFAGRVPTTTGPIHRRGYCSVPRIGSDETRIIARPTNFRANATPAPFSP